MPSNLSADERAAVDDIAWAIAEACPDNTPIVRRGRGEGLPVAVLTYGKIRTLLAVVARAGEPVARDMALARRDAFCDGWDFAHAPHGATSAACNGARREASVRYPLPTADARDRGDASADTRRLDWMDSNSFTAYRSRDPETSELCDHAVVVAEDAPSRFGNIGTIRAAIDHAMTAAPAAPEGK